MSFIDIDEVLPESIFKNGLHRRRLKMMFERLDKSWGVMTNTTASVMAVSLASVDIKHQEMTRELLTRMLMMSTKISDVWCIAVGSVTLPMPDQGILLEEAKDVSELGDKVSRVVDKFGLAIMAELLVTLPVAWTEHFKLLSATGMESTKVVDSGDTHWILSALSNEQQELTEKVVKGIVKCLDKGSSEVDIATQWVKAARATFNKSLDNGINRQEALRDVVSSLGFPKVMRNEQK